MLLGGVDFSSLFISLDGLSYPSLAAATAAGAPSINYGVFVNTILEFLIVALALFFVIKGINKSKKEEEAPLPNTKDCPYCRETILKEAVRCPHCTSALA